MKNRIKIKRKKLGITQNELANKLNVSRQYISLLEINKGEIPSLIFANKIAKALNSCIYSLFYLDGNEEFKCSCCK